MNIISGFFTRTLEQRIEDLQGKLASAEFDKKSAQDDYDSMALESIGGTPGAREKLLKAEGRVDAAERDIKQVQAALKAAETQKANADRQAAELNTEKDWDTCAEYAQRRLELATELDRELPRLLSKLKLLIEISYKMDKLAPQKTDSYLIAPGGLLSGDRLISIVTDKFKQITSGKSAVTLMGGNNDLLETVKQGTDCIMSYSSKYKEAFSPKKKRITKNKDAGVSSEPNIFA